jgi:prolipoprotein diacylglyceryltransferase
MKITDLLKKTANYIDVKTNVVLGKYVCGFFTLYGWQGFLLRVIVTAVFYFFLDDSMGAAKGYVVVVFLVIYSFAKLIIDYSKKESK